MSPDVNQTLVNENISILLDFTKYYYIRVESGIE
jgi:hypothetical protein